MSKKEAMVSDILYESPLILDKSDHCVIVFDVQFFTANAECQYKKNYYDKGDYDCMRLLMDSIDWEKALISCNNKVEEQWNFIMARLQYVKNQFIPNKIVKSTSQHVSNRPLNKETRQAVKRRRRAWQRYMETKDPDKYREYTRARNKVRSMTRKLQKKVETDITATIGENPEKFLKFVRSKVKTKDEVPDLINSRAETEDNLTKTDGEKAQVLADFFSDVFTQEPDYIPPPIEPRNYREMLETIYITPSEVQIKLKNISKWTRPRDQMKFTREYSEN